MWNRHGSTYPWERYTGRPRMVKILERVNGQSPMMDSGYGGQEELASGAGLRDGFHQSRTALAERVPGGRITSSNLRSKDDCGCPMARGRPWPGLPSV